MTNKFPLKGQFTWVLDRKEVAQYMLSKFRKAESHWSMVWTKKKNLKDEHNWNGQTLCKGTKKGKWNRRRAGEEKEKGNGRPY